MATASARLHIVDFIPKTVGGSVFVDGNSDGILNNGEKALSDVNVTISGIDFTGKTINVTVTTDASGAYSFKPGSLGLAPPDANGYTITEQALIGLLDGPAVERPDSQLVAVVNRSFVLNWGITDNSGDIGGLNFTEAGFDVRSVSQGGTLSDVGGFKQEYLASSGQNGFIFELNADGSMGWFETLSGLNTPNAWAGTNNISAVLKNSNSLLSFTWNGQTVNLTQGYSLNGIGVQINGHSYSTARFRILGIGNNGQYIIRVDGSSGSTATTPDGMFAMGAGGEGEAAVNKQYATSADAVFSEGAWA